AGDRAATPRPRGRAVTRDDLAVEVGELALQLDVLAGGVSGPAEEGGGGRGGGGSWGGAGGCFCRRRGGRGTPPPAAPPRAGAGVTILARARTELVRRGVFCPPRSPRVAKTGETYRGPRSAPRGHSVLEDPGTEWRYRP